MGPMRGNGWHSSRARLPREGRRSPEMKHEQTRLWMREGRYGRWVWEVVWEVGMGGGYGRWYGRWVWELGDSNRKLSVANVSVGIL